MRLPEQHIVNISYVFVLLKSHMYFRFLQPSPSQLTGSINHTEVVQWPAGGPLKTSTNANKGNEVACRRIT